MATDDEPENQEPLSKSARKREATRRQNIGRRLTQLKPNHLEQFNLPDKLLSAIFNYQRYPSHGAQRRQLQYIGRLMRNEDITVIEETLAEFDGHSSSAQYEFHQMEQWRDRLISEPSAMTEFIDAYPTIDRQQLRHLIKRARVGHDTEQAKATARALFRFIRDAIPDAG